MEGFVDKGREAGLSEQQIIEGAVTAPDVIPHLLNGALGK